MGSSCSHNVVAKQASPRRRSTKLTKNPLSPLTIAGQGEADVSKTVRTNRGGSLLATEESTNSAAHHQPPIQQSPPQQTIHQRRRNIMDAKKFQSISLGPLPCTPPVSPSTPQRPSLRTSSLTVQVLVEPSPQRSILSSTHPTPCLYQACDRTLGSPVTPTSPRRVTMVGVDESRRFGGTDGATKGTSSLPVALHLDSSPPYFASTKRWTDDVSTSEGGTFACADPQPQQEASPMFISGLSMLSDASITATVTMTTVSSSLYLPDYGGY